ncbi:hypothetical protein ABT121_04685 [Streptomyces sp. NPDC001928]|uniref:hypothetical protein n=1 Tax=Streptomyces sp. NPDC001928 TaxID=3154404 RepID=UPI00331F4C33
MRWSLATRWPQEIDRETVGQTATLERRRVDREREGALVHGPDPFHLAEVFGLAEKTAILYANSARTVLAQTAELSTSPSAKELGPA